MLTDAPPRKASREGYACSTVEESTASDLNTTQASTQYVLPRSDARITETARRAKIATLGVLARGSMAVASPVH